MRIPGDSFGTVINYNDFGTFGTENDLPFSYNFDFQGRIYLKVEITFFATKTIF